MAKNKSILSSAYDVTAKFVASIPKADRKRYGQFFTSEMTARFIASLFTLDYKKRSFEYWMLV